MKVPPYNTYDIAGIPELLPLNWRVLEIHGMTVGREGWDAIRSEWSARVQAGTSGRLSHAVAGSRAIYRRSRRGRIKL